ncbi:MAG: DNA double-strand break repair nuclease NurA [archaeon]
MQINGVISEAVASISELDSKRRLLGEKLLPLNNLNLLESGSEDFLEERLIMPVEKAELNCKIAGADSGFVDKDLFALDLVLIRAIGAVFSYNAGRLGGAEYFPHFYSFPEPHLSQAGLEADEFQCSKSIQRLIKEVGIARSLIEKFSPAFCFLDGSIVPQYADKPRKDSAVKSAYHEMLEEFQSLYSVAEESNCELVGCVEDSRGSRFGQILQQNLLASHKNLSAQLNGCYDAIILDYLLKPGERSMAFSYTASTKEHPILMDFDEKWSKSVRAFYLKPVAFDRPLRVEFLHHNHEGISAHASKIASIVFAQSCMHREYAFPNILVEADLHARLKQQEIEIVYDKILNKLGKGIKLRLRRDNRPL